jgi:hypothetical protein
MNQDEIYKKLLAIQTVCQDIMQSDLHEEVKYDMIFSDKISKQVFSLFNQTPIKFDYYDPDSSYEEDYQAFCYALDEHIINLKNNVQNQDIFDNFNSL